MKFNRARPRIRPAFLLWAASMGMTLFLGGCDYSYTDRLGVTTHYSSQMDQFQAQQADQAARAREQAQQLTPATPQQEQQFQEYARTHSIYDLGGMGPATTPDPGSGVDWQTFGTIGPNINGPASLGVQIVSSPPSFCTPPCGTFIIPP